MRSWRNPGRAAGSAQSGKAKGCLLSSGVLRFRRVWGLGFRVWGLWMLGFEDGKGVALRIYYLEFTKCIRSSRAKARCSISPMPMPAIC